MSEFGAVERTLFVPMLGRIYASENCQHILYDEKAVGLKNKLPTDLIERDIKKQSEYTLLASASRSANMDRYIRDFLHRKSNGAIIQIGCGLETTFYRNDNGKTQWYSVDLPDVIAYRKTLLAESERETYIAGDAFDDAWIKRIRNEAPFAPLLVVASGLFYYFEEEKVFIFLRMLQDYGEIEIVFDAVNKAGMTMMQKQYMKQIGHEDAKMFFYVDSVNALAHQISGDIRVLAEEKYYSHISKKRLKLSTRLNMGISDSLGMVKMIHLGFNSGSFASVNF